MAFEAYVRIEGKKQGLFKGDSNRADEPGRSRCLNFVNLVTSPRDVATGSATGKRRHTPVVLTKEWGAATPQIFTALVTNEGLATVRFEFMTVLPDGSEGVGFAITLVDAFVVSVRHYVGSAPGDVGTVRDLEDVAFTYRAIQIVNPVAQTEARDDWQD